MAARIAVERRNADQAVYAALAFEISVGEITLHAESCTFDSGLVAGLHVDDLILVAFAFEPAAVHPQENRSPVAGFGSAGARMDEKEAVHAVEFSGKEAEELHFVDLLFEIGVCGIGLREKGFILRGEFRESAEVVRMFPEILKRFDDVFLGAEFLNRFLGFLLVVPEIGSRHDLFQLPDQRLMVRNLQKFGKIGNSFRNFCGFRF